MNLNEKSLALFCDRFKQCVIEDSFFDDEGRQFGRFGSVRDYIRALNSFGGDARTPRIANPGGQADPTDLTQTLEQFARKAMATDTGDNARVGSLLRSMFCEPAVRYFAEEIADLKPENSAELWAEMNAKSWREWFLAVLEEERASIYADALYNLLMSLHGATPLLQFFIAPENLGNYSGWTDSTYLDVPQSEHYGRSYVGENVVTWGVAAPAPEQVDGVVGYEWQATLATPAGVEVCIVGVAYIFDRIDGVPQASKSGLLLAAGLVSDYDVKYVQVLLDQHQDADSLISNGDLCFIQRWERRPGSEKGLGAVCLQVALNELRGKLKNLNNAIFDIRPSQFLSWVDVVEPAQVAVAKQSAIESVTEFINGLDLARWTVRNTFSNIRWDQMSAVMAIGKQASEEGIDLLNEHADTTDFPLQGRELERGLAREVLSFAGHEEELMGLFDDVGMCKLATRIDDGIVADGEIELALKELLFGQRIHYLQLTASSGFDPADLAPLKILPPDEYDEEIDEFVDSLPDDVDLSRMYLLAPAFDSEARIADVVIEVSCITPYGVLYELFTLLPKPRPFNTPAWFSRTYNG